MGISLFDVYLVAAIFLGAALILAAGVALWAHLQNRSYRLRSPCPYCDGSGIKQRSER